MGLAYTSGLARNQLFVAVVLYLTKQSIQPGLFDLFLHPISLSFYTV